MYASAPAVGRWTGLGADPVYCMGMMAVGGDFTVAPDRKSLTLRPDDQPGKVFTFVEQLWNPPQNQNTIAYLADTFGMSGRAVLSGWLLSDGRIVATGSGGKLMVNQFAPTQPVNPDNPNCPTYAAAAAMFPPYPYGEGGTAEPEPEPPPPPWTGEQVATVRLQPTAGLPENVHVYGADGFTYKLASSSDETSATELATTAPQGPNLLITGKWDPGTLLVSVTSWKIEATGDRKYGVTPEGDIAPQSPDLPSTDWPGGPVPTTTTAAPDGGASSGGGVQSASLGIFVGLALLGAVMVGASKRKGEGQ